MLLRRVELGHRAPAGHVVREEGRVVAEAALPARDLGQDALAAGLVQAAGDRPVQVQSAPGLVTLFFSATPVRDYRGAQAADAQAYAAWCRALLARGVYPPPSQFEAWFPSLAHTPEHIERTLEAAAGAFAEIA